MAEQVALGQFTGMVTTFKNQSILLAMQPCVDLLTELVGNDEFQNRAGTDDSTRDHLIQLIAACDKRRRLITYNKDKIDIKSVLDIDITLESSLKPIALDNIQLPSGPDVEVPWKFDGTDPNIPLHKDLHFRNGVGGGLYDIACRILVNYTRLESRRATSMITVNDSIRMYTYMQGFHDLCVNLLGTDNQIDLAQPLATDEPANVVPPNRKTETSVSLTE
jgi:hypothetical protein